MQNHLSHKYICARCNSLITIETIPIVGVVYSCPQCDGKLIVLDDIDWQATKALIRGQQFEEERYYHWQGGELHWQNIFNKEWVGGKRVI